ncbi:MAG: decaprenyl-phosphate phosphoribosyltransferase [Anaerolineales bacterium]
MSTLSALFKTMRPRQWTKNAFVFGAVVFDRQLFIPESFLRTLAGFALFCLVSSAVYIFNDLVDLENDRQHPEKRHRPLPSGQLSPHLALIAAFLLLGMAISLGVLLSPAFSGVLVMYVVMMLAYSRWLKHIPILDVLTIAAGFVLRVHAGVTLIQVERFSPWLYVVTTLLALYLGFGKRRAELAVLVENAASHRRVLDGYTLKLLDQYILLVSGTTIVAYSLYTFSAPNLPPDHTMMLTIPFVFYGIFRYLYLIEVEHEGGAPEEVLLSDRPLQLTILLWILAVLVIFYLHPSVR